MLRPENHFGTLPIIKMTVPGVFPINIQLIKLYKSCQFMSTGLWKVGRHIVRLVLKPFTIYLFLISGIKCKTPFLYEKHGYCAMSCPQALVVHIHVTHGPRPGPVHICGDNHKSHLDNNNMILACWILGCVNLDPD